MIVAASTIIIVGGIKTLASGGGYGELNLMVTNNSGLYEGSTISAVAIAIIPIILWFPRFGTIFPPDWRVKTFCYALASSEERRVGQACVRKCRSRWSRYH